MATDKQIQANRANAKKSTGPRTQAGRAQSAKNGQSHSWLARTVVIPGESTDRFTALLTEFEEEYAPQTAVEQALVENIVTARWNLMRLMALQNTALIEEILRQQSAAGNDANTPPNPQSPSAVAAAAFRSLADQSHATDLLSRYQDRYDRQFHRAVLRLSQIRTNFEKEGAKPIKPFESIT
jgi:hypothetical protein